MPHDTMKLLQLMCVLGFCTKLISDLQVWIVLVKKYFTRSSLIRDWSKGLTVCWYFEIG